MKVYSWNVLRSNRKLSEMYRFIRELDFDILSLQEVTEEMLTEIKEMPFHIVYCVDRFAEALNLFSKNKTEVNYAVIISRYEIRKHGKLEFPKLLTSFNSRVFEFLLRLLQKWESITNLGAVYADIEIEGTQIRVFSAHLALWNPKTRANEFKHLMTYLPANVPTIICADMNILEYGPVKMLNWLFGGSLYEGMPWYPERELFEERFKKFALANPLRGQITHKFSHSQLDHILVSPQVEVTKAWVEFDSHGSDHQPIGVECKIEKSPELSGSDTN